MLRSLLLCVFCAWLCRAEVPVRAVVGRAPISPSTFAIDAETIAGPHHFERGFPADEPDGSVNAVIEIPAGTTAKFETDPVDGRLHWARDRETGGRREVDYLAFPASYGMVPRTLGGDGDALDILVLGASLERAAVVRTRVIGVIAMADDGGRDDKLVAVPLDSALANGFTRLHDLPELDARYPAVRAILALYFTHYWGVGNTRILGWGDAAEAAAILADAKADFSSRTAGRTAPRLAADSRPRASSPSAVRAH